MGQTFMSNVFSDFAAQRDIYVVSAVKSTVKDVFSGNSTGSHSVIVEHDGRKQHFTVFLAPGIDANEIGHILEFLLGEAVDGLYYFSPDGQSKDDDISRRERIRKHVEQLECRLIHLLGKQLFGELLQLYYAIEDVAVPVPAVDSCGTAETVVV